MKDHIFYLNRTIVIISLIACLFGFNHSIAQSSDIQSPIYVLKKVNVISMENDQILKNYSVVIKGGKIVDLGSARNIKAPKNAIKIKSKGKYLLPGIAEMHAHIPVPQEDDDSNVRDVLFLYLSNGITTIRGMLGNPYHLELKQRVLSNEILGPRIYTSAPSLNGNSVKTKEEARKKVSQYCKDGYDFLKMHPGLSLENFNEIVQTADEVGIKMAGHVSTAVGVTRSIEAGYASIDHLDGYLEGLVPESEGVHPDSNGFFGFNFTEKVDLNLMPDLLQKTKDQNVWIVPTHSLMVHILGAEDPNVLANRPEMKYVSSKTRYQWKSVKQQVMSEPGFTKERSEKFLSIRDNLLKSMQEAGVNILLGSDAPQIFNVPGFSIQHEMQSMFKAGLTPFQILKSGTVNPATFFNESGNYGVVAKGASADLILLDENPLEDIRNMKEIEGIMVRGKWLSRSFIDGELAKIAAKYN